MLTLGTQRGPLTLSLSKGHPEPVEGLAEALPSARAALRAGAGSDEEPDSLARHVGRVPHARGVYRVFARRERCAHLFARDLLDQRDRSFDADDDFGARRVHFPAGPVLGEAEARDEAPVIAVTGVARAVVHVPLHRTLIV